MKTIQMTIDEILLEQVDQLVKLEGTNRSAFMRQALEDALRRHRIVQLEKQHAKGYRQHPSQLEEFEPWQTEQVWPDDDEWSDT